MSTSDHGVAVENFDYSDTQTLTRLANELFAALPGEHPKIGGALNAATAEFARQGGIAGLTPDTLDPVALAQGFGVNLGAIPGFPGLPEIPGLHGIPALPRAAAPVQVPAPELAPHVPVSTPALPQEKELLGLFGSDLPGVPGSRASGAVPTTLPALERQAFAPAAPSQFYFLGASPAAVATPTEGGGAL
ncbi:MAG: hypothetical protein Q8J78_07785, partial [Moraxellaceae bacterium]|nr:hypothetical protein [Moraxellaceae bacterium]